jgi:hydrogenase maturation protease
MNPVPSPSGEAAILVIGYGNTLRRDDAVGPRLAEEIGDIGYPGVRAVSCPQLSPEHAPLVAAADVVVFVDALEGGDRRLRLLPVDPAGSGQVTTHALEPGTLLALAREVFGRAPRAWLLPVPADDLGFGEELSPIARAGMAEARRVLDGFIQLRLAQRVARECPALLPC